MSDDTAMALAIAADQLSEAHKRIAELEAENERLREQRNSLRKNIEQTALATGYAQGLEDAAKVCEELREDEMVAATIRALTEKGNG